MNMPIKQPKGLRDIDQPDRALLLIVDDQTSNIAILYEIFKTDYEVCMATTGEDALRLCQGRKPDLILLDVVMPGMSGFELCRRLKRDAATSGIPIIFVTGQDDPIEEARGLEEGGVDFITKPFHATVVRARVHTHIALQRQAEQLRAQRLELEQSHARLRLITDAVPAMIGYVDHEERYRFCNRQYEQVLGLTPAQMIGATLREVYGEEAYSTIHEHVRAVLTGKLISFERTNMYAGEILYLQCEYVPDIADDGRTIGFYALLTNITAHRTLQRNLADSERRLRTVTENIPALVAHLDSNERYLFINAQVGKVFGKDPAKMIGRTISEEYAPELYELVKPHIDKVLTGRIASFEGQAAVLGGELYFQSTYIPDRNADGVVQGFFAMSFDITRRKTAELLQAENEKRLRTITDNLPALITYIDRGHRVQFANATMQEWTDKPMAEVNGKLFEDVMGGTLYDERHQHLTHALAGNRVEFEMTADGFGRVRHLHSTYIPDFDEHGVVRGIYTLSHDISKLKTIEQELRKLARFDSLTNLPNRAHLYELLDAALARAKRRRKAIAVCFLDIDHFKSINDSMGHANGDLVLCEFAARLEGAVRATDTVARLSGDEFIIILEDLGSVKEAELVAQKILEAARSLLQVGEKQIFITTSIGIAFDATLDQTGPAIIAAADSCLYEAKAAGRNTYRTKSN